MYRLHSKCTESDFEKEKLNSSNSTHMKKLFLTTALFGCIALMTACGGNVNSLLGGTKYPADQADSYAKAVEVLKEKVDTTKFKIFAIRFNEKEELSNELSSMSLDMVNADNYAFRQAYYMDGRVGPMNDYSTSVNEIDFENVKGISLSKIDPATIGRQIEEAKQIIPEGHTFRSVSIYEISEVLPKKMSMLNRGKEVGTQETNFKICFTEDGKETETSGGQVTHLYYEANVIVNPDGSITPEEE